ncbi:MAG: phosphopentomutase [Melioribacteraceae bacterium]|nr:phosphopentomutase [Melioribacteraceae bacterium]
MNNFFIVVLDGVGVGEMPDAASYGDAGSNTIANIAKSQNGISLPNLQKFGLGNITDIEGVPPESNPLASWGKLTEISLGKDSTTGHWELGGVKVDFDFPYYPNGFPQKLVDEFIRLTDCGGILGNIAASGTEIIKELGDEHVKTSYPIVYTSADSVFQIAAHEEVIPLERQYEICKIARNKLLVGGDSVGRVIARPFVGTSGNYVRTTNRKDFSIDPSGKTILDLFLENNINTVAIGKVNDLFNYRGIKVQEKTKSNKEGIKKIIDYTAKVSNSLIFTNLVDFDVYYGHRLDPGGFYKALKEFDDELPNIIGSLDESDAIVFTADHGNDPTVKSTDHTREYVPLLYFRKNKDGVDLGTRETFSDVAQTAAHFFKVNNSLKGKSFLNQ